MSDFVFNIARGKVGTYAGLPAANDAFIVVLLKTTGLDPDDTLNNFDDLAALLAANNECDFTNYTRKTLASVTFAVDDTANTANVDAADFTYTAAGGGTNNSIGKLLVCYDPDTTGGIDSSIIPLLAYDLVYTTSGIDLDVSIDPGGLWLSS